MTLSCVRHFTTFAEPDTFNSCVKLTTADTGISYIAVYVLMATNKDMWYKSWKMALLIYVEH